MTVRFIPALEHMTPYEPGLPLEIVVRRHGLTEVVKLASNESPLPPFPEVRDAIVAGLDDLNRYPDGDCTDLRVALADRFGLTPADFVIGAGSCELLMLLGDAVLEKGDQVVFADPSFVVYNDICLRHDAEAVAVPTIGFAHDLEAMAAAVTPRTKLLIVCNPNNPTGVYSPVAEVARLVEQVPGDVLVIIDEAYNEFVTAGDSRDALRLLAEHDNVVVLRTFSKIYGLSGLRVGYGICRPEVARAVDKLRQPFNVNRLAQVAAVTALSLQDQVAARRDENARLRDLLASRLAERGRASVPSQANFMLVDIRDLRLAQEEVCGALLEMGAIVRDGNALGCPGWARVSVGTQEEIEFFLRRLASLEVGSSREAGEGRPS
jgi:histidinol-phosphate aminotransferase